MGRCRRAINRFHEFGRQGDCLPGGCSFAVEVVVVFVFVVLFAFAVAFTTALVTFVNVELEDMACHSSRCESRAASYLRGPPDIGLTWGLLKSKFASYST